MRKQRTKKGQRGTETIEQAALAALESLGEKPFIALVNAVICTRNEIISRREATKF